MTDRRTVLIAGMGTSPAVLTETVWALCHRPNPTVPDEIVVIVTKSGKERLCAKLLSGEVPVWDQMLAALKKERIDIDGKLVFGETSIRVIPDERGNGAWYLRTFREGSRFANLDDIDDLRKTLSELRKKLKSAGFANAESQAPQRGNPVTYPLGRIVWRDGESLADIRGCPKGPRAGREDV